MRNLNQRALSGAFAALLAAGGCVPAVRGGRHGDTARAAADRSDLAEVSVAQWSNDSRLAARGLIEKYGVPDEVHFGRLVWNRRGPWKRIAVRDIRPGYVEGDDLGLIEETVDYALPAGREVDLAALGGAVTFDPRAGELSSRADREALNCLGLNLADDALSGRLSVQDARAAYAKIVDLELSGKSSPYLLSLRFGSR